MKKTTTFLNYVLTASFAFGLICAPSVGWGDILGFGSPDLKTKTDSSNTATSNLTSPSTVSSIGIGEQSACAEMRPALGKGIADANAEAIKITKANEIIIKKLKSKSEAARIHSWVDSCVKHLDVVGTCYTEELKGALEMSMHEMETACLGMGASLGGHTNAKMGQQGFQQAQNAIVGAQASCMANKLNTTDEVMPSRCETACGQLDLDAAKTSDIQMATDKETAQPLIEADYKVAREFINKCNIDHKSAQNKFVQAEIMAQGFSATAGHTAKMFKVGAAVGGAAIVGGILLKQHKDEAAKEKKEKKKEKDFENGITKNADGDKLNCLSPDTYTATECKPVLLNYCGKSENASKAGCTAFKTNYCNAEDASQTYCLANSAKNYCAQAAPGVDKTQSPSCLWMGSRPSTCSKNANDVQCLTKMSPAELTSVCAKFLSDPLCQAHLNGKVVTQPSGSTWSAGNESQNSSGGGLNAIVGSSEQASNGENLFGANSNAYAELCKSGKLVNCK